MSVPVPAASPPRGLRVLVVEDHVALREGLALLLQGHGITVAGVADRVDTGYERYVELRPEVTVVDLQLGDGDGLDLVARIRASDPESAILIYTAGLRADALRSMATQGVRGYVLKTGRLDDLAGAIRTVAGGGVYLDPDLSGRPADPGLTAREREILSLLAEGMTGEQVAEDLFLAPETVRTHIRNAMRKLGANTRVQAVVSALRAGEITSRS